MKKILIVDDNSNHAETMKDLLMTKDFQVDTANNFTQALELYNKVKSYDLILMDLVMDDKNGIDTFNAIKEIDPNVQAIYFTAFGVQEDGETGLLLKAVSVGMHEEYLRKPIAPEELFDAVNKHTAN